MTVFLRKYNTATAAGTHIRVPIVKAGAVDFAINTDWTPAAGDVKLSKDGGTQANIGTLPTYSEGAWQFQLTAAELSTKQLEIMVVDSATKAVEDQAILVETFGNSSAMYPQDLSLAAGAGGRLSVDTTALGGDVTAATNAKDFWLNAITTGAVNDVGATTTDFDTDLSEASDDHYNDLAMVFTSGNLKGQVRRITDYTGSTKNCSFTTAWTEAPADTDTFIILGRIE